MKEGKWFGSELTGDPKEKPSFGRRVEFDPRLPELENRANLGSLDKMDQDIFLAARRAAEFEGTNAARKVAELEPFSRERYEELTTYRE